MLHTWFTFDTAIFLGWPPYSDGIVVRNGGEHLVVNRVPGDTVDGSGMSLQGGNWDFLFDVPDINLIVWNWMNIVSNANKYYIEFYSHTFASTSHKVLIVATEAAVDGEVPLSDTLKLSH